MQMTALEPANLLQTRRLSRSLLPVWKSAGSATVHADRKRIFSALTLPEYMETWISLPGTAAENAVTVLPVHGGFQINGSSFNGEKICIEGQYLVRRRGRIVFTWKHSKRDAWQTMIAIRLIGDFSRTNVNVMYSAIHEQDGNCWVRDFWRCSLQRLDSLF